MSDAVKFSGAQVASDAWIEGVESPEFKTLIDAKQRSIVPMIVIYVVGYLGLSVLAGFGRGILGTKVQSAPSMPYSAVSPVKPKKAAAEHQSPASANPF
jgi:hypothetical protein